MRLVRPSSVFFRKSVAQEFDLGSLLSGGAGVSSRDRWTALAPHSGEEHEIELEDFAVLDAVSSDEGTDVAWVRDSFGSQRVDRLLDLGLLLDESDRHAGLRKREQAITATGWWPLAVLMQVFGRWSGVDVSDDYARNGVPTLARKLELDGAPPAATIEVRPGEPKVLLPKPRKGGLDELLSRRTTCRNFSEIAVPIAELGDLLHRVFGAQATQVLAPGAVALKKNSPSGGALHPIEAYVLVQRVDGLPCGTYHYHPVDHALVPMQNMPATEAADAARRLVAGQAWFAAAPILILMAARFDRSFWKYRNHAKAWKVIQLDAGHLSQVLYLTATERGYGAFVTGAINDTSAEELFELDGVVQGPVAVCGFGTRAKLRPTVELDPLGRSAIGDGES